MDDENIFARSFCGKQVQKLACGVFIGSFIIGVSLCIVFKPYLDLPFICENFYMDSMKSVIYNFSNSRSDGYEIKGDIRIHGNSSTIFIASGHYQNMSSWTIKPYARKSDIFAMRRVTEYKVKMEAAEGIPNCSRDLSNIPTIVFSGRGHAGNFFHAFADLLFPLFLTSHQFNRSIIFLVTDLDFTWTSKYREILESLSKYDVYDIDKETDILCFSRMTVGLKAPESLFIHPSESKKYPIANFTKFLRNAYSLERESMRDPHKTGKASQPRMLIISREKRRRLLNEHEIGDLARSLGFDVVVKQAFSNVSLFAKFVNSFDVMVAVHGAGITNMAFLPENAVLIQIAPFGLEFFSKICYEWAAESMKLRYLEYKISLNESSLLGKYPPDSEVYRDPSAIEKKDFARFHSVYLNNQDVNLDLDRFRKTLLKALELVGI